MSTHPTVIDVHIQATKLVTEALSLCEQAGLELVVMLLEDAMMILGEGDDGEDMSICVLK